MGHSIPRTIVLPVPVSPAAPLPRFLFIVRLDDSIHGVRRTRTKKKAGTRPAMKVFRRGCLKGLIVVHRSTS